MQQLPPILHFNTLAQGGAAAAARKIHDSLSTSGIESWFHFVGGDASLPNYEKLRFHSRHGIMGRILHGAIQRIRTHIGSRPSGFFEPFGWSTIPGRELDFTIADRAPILHLHWVVGLVDYRHFFRGIPIETPIVWTLHDLNPMTGGCHYAWSCDGFVDRCDQCPQLAALWALSTARKNQDLRTRVLANRNLHIVADSRWVEKEARRSRVLGSARSFRTIHYGVDLNIFQPQDSATSKRQLGIPDSNPVIAFGSGRLDTLRKGFIELCAALSRIGAENSIELLTFGERGAVRGPDGVRWKHLGPIHSQNELAVVYNATDVFVMPSLQEAFGQTAQEALACATPVVAFEVGGVPDSIRPNQTGLLARIADTDHLAKQILTLVRDPEERKRLGRNGRKLMEREFSLDQQRDRYLELYQSISAPR